MNTPFEFEEVCKLKTGTQRENSLFNYIDDCFNNLNPVEQHTFKSTYQCTKRSGERSAYFISPRNLENTCSLILDGYNLLDCHLSVDKNHSLETSASASSYYTASHITLVFQQIQMPQEGRIIRVYFNQLNQLINDPIHMLACTLDKNHRVVQQKERLTMDGALIQAVYSNEQFQQHKLTLNNLSEAKCKKYMAECSFSYQLSDKLAGEVQAQQWLEAKQSAQELKKLTQTITRYNDTLIDTRTQYLNRLIAFYDQLIDTPPVISPNPRDLNANLSAVEASLACLDLQRDSLPARLTAEDALKNDIETLVQSIQTIMLSTQHSFAERLINRHSVLERLEECCLILSLNAKNSQRNNQFIQTQKAKISSDTMSLLEHFKQALEQGNLDLVIQLHDTVSIYYDLSPVFAEFLGNILDVSKTMPNPDAMLGKIAIADYFYTCSSLYQSSVKLMHASRLGSNDNMLSSLLLNCFMNDNEQAFKLLLRQGVLLHDIHFTVLGTKLAFNALQAVILHYRMNPKLNYVQWMIEHGAEMTFSKQWVQVIGALRLDKNNKIKSSPYSLKSVSRKSGAQSDTNSLINLLEILVPASNALAFAIKMTNTYHYPELSTTFIQHMSCEDAIIALQKMLIGPMFRSIHVMLESENGPDINHQIDDSQIIFKDRNSIEKHFDASISGALTPNDCYTIRVFYYVPESTPNPEVVLHYVTSILNAVKAKFQSQSTQEQSLILIRMFMLQKKESPPANRPPSINIEQMGSVISLHYAIELAYRWMATHSNERLNSQMQKSFDLVRNFLASLLKDANKLSADVYENAFNAQVRITQIGDYFARHLPSNRKNSPQFFQPPTSLNEDVSSGSHVKGPDGAFTPDTI